MIAGFCHVAMFWFHSDQYMLVHNRFCRYLQLFCIPRAFSAFICVICVLCIYFVFLCDLCVIVVNPDFLRESGIRNHDLLRFCGFEVDASLMIADEL